MSMILLCTSKECFFMFVEILAVHHNQELTVITNFSFNILVFIKEKIFHIKEHI